MPFLYAGDYYGSGNPDARPTVNINGVRGWIQEDGSFLGEEWGSWTAEEVKAGLVDKDDPIEVITVFRECKPSD